MLCINHSQIFESNNFFINTNIVSLFLIILIISVSIKSQSIVNSNINSFNLLNEKINTFNLSFNNNISSINLLLEQLSLVHENNITDISSINNIDNILTFLSDKDKDQINNYITYLNNDNLINLQNSYSEIITFLKTQLTKMIVLYKNNLNNYNDLNNKIETNKLYINSFLFNLIEVLSTIYDEITQFKYNDKLYWINNNLKCKFYNDSNNNIWYNKLKYGDIDLIFYTSGSTICGDTLLYQNNKKKINPIANYYYFFNYLYENNVQFGFIYNQTSNFLQNQINNITNLSTMIHYSIVNDYNNINILQFKGYKIYKIWIIKEKNIKEYIYDTTNNLFKLNSIFTGSFDVFKSTYINGYNSLEYKNGSVINFIMRNKNDQSAISFPYGNDYNNIYSNNIEFYPLDSNQFLQEPNQPFTT